MLYHLYEWQRMAVAPYRMAAELTRQTFKHPLNPLAETYIGKQICAAADVFEHSTRSYGKPSFDLPTTFINGQEVAITEEIVNHRTFGDLLHFKREGDFDHPRLLIVAPMSGHYATLLRGTVEAMLPDHDVYITDWRDARQIHIHEGSFGFNDYVDYLIDFLHFLGPNTHILAVCQPSVPVLAAVSIMSSWGDICVPASMTLMGGPIDTRQNPTQVNQLALEHDLDWFKRNVIVSVPAPYPGVGRKVYPGFVQLTNFIAMNLDRHIEAHKELFDHLVEGDEDSADKKRSFYEEYRAVMDLPSEFYLETVEHVFQKHSLPKGEMVVRWQPVRPECITKTALLCVEGEEDDISGVGQTKAALDLTINLPDHMKEYHLQEKVGHYGVFNGSKWRKFIAPKIKNFILTHDHRNNEALTDMSDWKGPDRRKA